MALRKFLLSLLFFLLISELSSAQYFSLKHDGLKRTYLLHLPKDYSNNKSYSLIIAMHGGFGNAFNLQKQSGLSEKADKENFIVVYPEGIEGKRMKARTWNAGWCCGYASKSNTDDVGFINSLLDTLINNYQINANRIYATGMSNGGFMSYRLACEQTGRIAAIAPVAASMSMTDCNPEVTMPIIHFHSYNDKSVPLGGGLGGGISKHYNAPLDSVLQFWSSNNNCSDRCDTIIDNSHFTFIKSTNCVSGAEIEYYITQDGGHSWPGGKQTVIGDRESEFVNATDLMWTFFDKHPKVAKNK